MFKKLLVYCSHCKAHDHDFVECFIAHPHLCKQGVKQSQTMETNKNTNNGEKQFSKNKVNDFYESNRQETSPIKLHMNESNKDGTKVINDLEITENGTLVAVEPYRGGHILNCDSSIPSTDYESLIENRVNPAPADLDYVASLKNGIK